MKYIQILSDIDNFIRAYVESHHDPRFCFHNFAHIQTVLAGVEQMGNFYKLNEEEFFVLKAAAYFHDLYYISHGPLDHEEMSARIAKSFLEEEGIEERLVTLVESCIKATKYKQHTTTKLEAILCDADLCHLSSIEFENQNLAMLKEINNLRGIDFDEDLWIAISLRVLEDHQFYTDYGIQTLNKGKQENTEILKNKLNFRKSISRIPQ